MFPKRQLGSCISSIRNGAVITQLKDAQGLPITRIETLSNGCFNRDKFGYANIFDASEYEDYILDDKDILISHINSKTYIGRSVLYRKEGDECIIHGMNLLRVIMDENVMLKEYAAFFFNTRYFKRLVDSIKKDAVNQSSFSITDFCKLEVPVPDIDYQKRVLQVLLPIDRKIALNRKINAELEQMAKELYDYWFVQFDFPNAEGKPYKSSGGKMVYNPQLKRDIPEGWEVKSIENSTIILKDGTHNPPKRINDGIPLLTGQMFGLDFLDYSKATFVSLDDYKQIHSSYQPQASDFVMTKIGTVGKVNYITNSDLPITIHCNSAIIRFNPEMHGLFTYYYLKSELFQLRLKAVLGQSIQEFAGLDAIGSILVETPPNKIIKEFDKKINAVFSMKVKMHDENKELTSLRDQLLPLLMNGQVTIG